MNTTRLALAALAATVVDGIYGFLVYGNALTKEFGAFPGVFRSAESGQTALPLMFAGILVGMLAVSYIYAGYEGRSGLLEGLRFGLLIGIFDAGYFIGVDYGILNIGRRMAVVMALAGLGNGLSRVARLVSSTGPPRGPKRKVRRLPRYDVMMTMATKAGLEDTVATSSAICYLDGDRGVLLYCGYDIHDLAAHATFEEVVFLLRHRRLPTRAELGDLQSALAAARPLPEPILRLMRTLPSDHAMDALRTLRRRWSMTIRTRSIIRRRRTIARRFGSRRRSD